MKTCQEIQKEINELKRKLCNKNFLTKDEILLEQAKCDSESSIIKCEKCNCWKMKKELYG